MFTTGSKLLIGSAFATWVFALVYGVTQEGALGTIGLISAAVALSALAAINVFVRDSNVSAMDHEAFDASAAAQASARGSLWPLLVALGATSMTLGLVTLPAYFIIGGILIAAGLAEWMVQGWSERASADPRYNSDARNFLIDPLELPVAGAILFGVVAYSFSRVMLGLPSKSATVVAFSILGALILAVGSVLGLKRGASRATLTGTFGLAAVALAAGGTVAGLNGERDIEPHHTTAFIAQRGECGTDETEADEHASQSVAGKSNVAAEVVFDGVSLTWEVPGFVAGVDDAGPLTLPRSTPSNVMFRNESDAPARLVIAMHPRLDDSDQPTGPEQICSALVDEGAVQFLTLEFAQPSFAVEDGYAFTVPGSDATLDVVVP